MKENTQNEVISEKIAFVVETITRKVLNSPDIEGVSLSINKDVYEDVMYNFVRVVLPRKLAEMKENKR